MGLGNFAEMSTGLFSVPKGTKKKRSFLVQKINLVKLQHIGGICDSFFLDFRL